MSELQMLLIRMENFVLMCEICSRLKDILQAV
jgi:hypothetical protein